MTPDSAARVYRAVGITADEWTAVIMLADGLSRTEANRRRKACDPGAMRHLAGMIRRQLAGSTALGIDPGRSGYIVGVDATGAHVHSISLGSLYYDEAPDGPAAAKRWNAAIKAGTAPKGARRHDPNAQHRKAIHRLDPVALRFLADTLGELGIPIGIEQCGYRPSVDLLKLVKDSCTVYLARFGTDGRKAAIDAAMATARKIWAMGESAQSANTTADNWGRIRQAFPGAHIVLIRGKGGWQDSQRTSKGTCDRWTSADRYWLRKLPGGGVMPEPVPDQRGTLEERHSWNGSIKATKVRSLYMARRAGLATLKDGEADAFHIANHVRERLTPNADCHIIPTPTETMDDRQAS